MACRCAQELQIVPYAQFCRVYISFLEINQLYSRFVRGEHHITVLNFRSDEEKISQNIIVELSYAQEQIDRLADATSAGVCGHTRASPKCLTVCCPVCQPLLQPWRRSRACRLTRQLLPQPRLPRNTARRRVSLQALLPSRHHVMHVIAASCQLASSCRRTEPAQQRLQRRQRQTAVRPAALRCAALAVSTCAEVTPSRRKVRSR